MLAEPFAQPLRLRDPHLREPLPQRLHHLDLIAMDDDQLAQFVQGVRAGFRPALRHGAPRRAIARRSCLATSANLGVRIGQRFTAVSALASAPAIRSRMSVVSAVRSPALRSSSMRLRMVLTERSDSGRSCFLRSSSASSAVCRSRAPARSRAIRAPWSASLRIPVPGTARATATARANASSRGGTGAPRRRRYCRDFRSPCAHPRGWRGRPREGFANRQFGRRAGLSFM